MANIDLQVKENDNGPLDAASFVDSETLSRVLEKRKAVKEGQFTDFSDLEKYQQFCLQSVGKNDAATNRSRFFWREKIRKSFKPMVERYPVESLEALNKIDDHILREQLQDIYDNSKYKLLMREKHGQNLEALSKSLGIALKATETGQEDSHVQENTLASQVEQSSINKPNLEQHVSSGLDEFKPDDIMDDSTIDSLSLDNGSGVPDLTKRLGGISEISTVDKPRIEPLPAEPIVSASTEQKTSDEESYTDPAQTSVGAAELVAQLADEDAQAVQQAVKETTAIPDIDMVPATGVPELGIQVVPEGSVTSEVIPKSEQVVAPEKNLVKKEGVDNSNIQKPIPVSEPAEVVSTSAEALQVSGGKNIKKPKKVVPANNINFFDKIRNLGNNLTTDQIHDIIPLWSESTVREDKKVPDTKAVVSDEIRKAA